MLTFSYFTFSSSQESLGKGGGAAFPLYLSTMVSFCKAHVVYLYFMIQKGPVDQLMNH